MSHKLHIGLIINPLAGLGGSLAMKGSDGEDLRRIARDMPAEQRRRALDRVERALAPLRSRLQQIVITTWAGPMGADAMVELDRSVPSSTIDSS